MKFLVIVVPAILLQGFFVNVLGNAMDSNSLPEKGAFREYRNSEKNIIKHLLHENDKNSSDSVTYVSTYTLPTLIWSSHHSKKLRDKIRKHRSFNRVKPNNMPRAMKILSKMDSDAFLDMHNKDEDQIQLPIEKMFVNTNFITEIPLNYENVTTLSNVTDLGDNVHKVSKKKKKRKNRKRSKSISTSLQNVNNTTTSNDNDLTSTALSIAKEYLTDVGESRTFSLILFMNAIFVPAIILEILTIGAFIFVSPVVGLSLLVVTIVGAILTAFTFLIFI